MARRWVRSFGFVARRVRIAVDVRRSFGFACGRGGGCGGAGRGADDAVVSAMDAEA